MKLTSANIAPRFWVLLLLLAYAAQSLGAIGWNNDVSADAMEGCHEMVSTAVSEPHVNSTASQITCCDEDCSMDSCHSTGAMLSRLSAPNLPILKTLHTSPLIRGPSKTNVSLYRPPILA